MRVLLAIFGLSCAAAFGQTFQEKRWDDARINASRMAEVDRICDRIEKVVDRYKAVDSLTSCPWYVIACLHNLESGGSFKHHLHEGSSLMGRTKYEPKGRPLKGKPPFSWEESAVDALEYDKMGLKLWAYLHDTLMATELYNGGGYLKYHPEVVSPYLGGGTNQYIRGKYVADKKWSSTAISQQIGAIAIWKRLQDRGRIDFSKLKRKTQTP